MKPHQTSTTERVTMKTNMYIYSKQINKIRQQTITTETTTITNI